MVTVFSNESVCKVWAQAAKVILNTESESSHNIYNLMGRDGEVRELLHCVFTIDNPHFHWVVSRLPPMNPAFAIVEIVGLICGINNARFYNYWNRSLPKFAGHTESYSGNYGYRLNRHFDILQLEKAYYALSANPNTRQIVLQYYDVKVDLPKDNGVPTSLDVPCNVVSMLKIREGKLEWTQVVRSNDVFLGLPYNFAQFTYLQEIISGWLNVDQGSYTHISDTLHVYKRDVNRISIEEIVPARNGDKFRESFDDSIKSFESMKRYINELIDSSLGECDHIKVLEKIELKLPYKNMMHVLIAESARKNKLYHVSEQAILACTNPSLVQIWEKWYESRMNYKR